MAPGLKLFKDKPAVDAEKMSSLIHAPISLGELVDKITILEIKLQRVLDGESRALVSKELDLLSRLGDLGLSNHRIAELKNELRAVNETLWTVEDELRLAEDRREFGPQFIELARSVYRTNDHRAKLKRDINSLVGSEIQEIKIHPIY